MPYLDKRAEIKVKLKFLGCSVSKQNDAKLFLKSWKFMIFTDFQLAASSESFFQHFQEKRPKCKHNLKVSPFRSTFKRKSVLNFEEKRSLL